MLFTVLAFSPFSLLASSDAGGSFAPSISCFPVDKCFGPY
uniref:Uncharacterized protein n=1 Tax=Rhizophora mucronata TaxID=61149 RepID=A0A2P2PF85_RHIMU